MDDTQDKVRRNLVVVSSLIVAAAFFGLTLKAGVAVADLGILTSASPVRFWIAALVVLVYCFQRYWFDADTETQAEKLKQRFEEAQWPYVKPLLARDMERAFQGKPPRYFGSDAQVYVDNFWEGHNQREGVKVSVVIDGLSHRPLAGRAGLIVTVTPGGRTSGGLMPAYKFGRLHGLLVTVPAACKIAAFSKSGVDFIAPLLLALSALVTCIYRLATA